MYTFHVQGQVYHFLNGFSSNNKKESGIHFYFYDLDEEVSRRLNSSSRLNENTTKLLSHVLQFNPYSQFFRNLCHVPDLKDHSILLKCTPELDQHRYNLPSSSQVATILFESDDSSLDRTSHIQVYSHSDVSHRIKHFTITMIPFSVPFCSHWVNRAGIIGSKKLTQILSGREKHHLQEKKI